MWLMWLIDVTWFVMSDEDNHIEILSNYAKSVLRAMST